MEKGLEGRFLITNGSYDNQQVLDFVHKKFPEEAKKLNVIVGKPGEYSFKDPAMYKVDNSKSIKEVSAPPQTGSWILDLLLLLVVYSL